MKFFLLRLAALSALAFPSFAQETLPAELVKAAQAEGEVNSVGMPDAWANWKDTWDQIAKRYGIQHFDTDMSSAQELQVFENEGKNATADLGDVGLEFGPIAVARDLVQPYQPTTWNQIPDWAKDREGKWVVAYTGTIAFIIANDLAQKPQTWADLLKGDYSFSINSVGQAAQSNAAVLAAAIAKGGGETNLTPGLRLFSELAKQGRLRSNEVNPASLERGEIQVAAIWDFNAMSYSAAVGGNRYSVVIPQDGSVTSGYASVINKWAKHPNAAKLTREYIFSDQGQINLANGYARPIRVDRIKMPEETLGKLLPSELYKAARPIDPKAWQQNAPKLGALWQQEVLTQM